MREIPGRSKDNSEWLKNLHIDVFDVAKTLLLQHHWFLKEDVIALAGKRKARDVIRWEEVIVPELNDYFVQFGLKIAPQNRSFVRAMTEAEGDEKLILRSKLLLDHLHKKAGSGNETVAYGFLGWPNREHAERQIRSVEHKGGNFLMKADDMRSHVFDESMPLIEQSKEECTSK